MHNYLQDGEEETGDAEEEECRGRGNKDELEE